MVIGTVVCVQTAEVVTEMAIGIIMSVTCLVACKRRLSSGDDAGEEATVSACCLVS